jgi:hypothetical protein
LQKKTHWRTGMNTITCMIYFQNMLDWIFLMHTYVTYFKQHQSLICFIFLCIEEIRLQFPHFSNYIHINWTCYNTNICTSLFLSLQGVALYRGKGHVYIAWVSFQIRPLNIRFADSHAADGYVLNMSYMFVHLILGR